jgi:Tfp pilus assembly protein PilO
MNLRLRDLRDAALRLGWTGRLGLVLLAVAVVLHVVRVVALEREITTLQAEAGNLQQRLRSGQALGNKPNESSAEQLAAFYAYFPSSESAPALLGKVHAAAAANGIVLRSGEYKFERQADQKLARYRMTLPVVGSYSQVRRFIAAVLADVPAASVDEIQLRRENIASTTLEARIRLSLYLRS